jgi:hypothetical protein
MGYDLPAAIGAVIHTNILANSLQANIRIGVGRRSTAVGRTGRTTNDEAAIRLILIVGGSAVELGRRVGDGHLITGRWIVTAGIRRRRTVVKRFTGTDARTSPIAGRIGKFDPRRLVEITGDFLINHRDVIF